ncbi:unnamed protein product, partial [Rotaria magnacalcarata]
MEPFSSSNFISTMQQPIFNTVDTIIQSFDYSPAPMNDFHRPLNSLTHNETEALMKCLSPITDSSSAHHDNETKVNKSLLSILQDMRGEMRLISDRLTHVERSRVSQKSINVESKVRSTYSHAFERSTSNLSQRSPIQTELDRTYSPYNNNQLKLHGDQSLSTTHVAIPPALLSSHHESTSAFHPIYKPVSENCVHIKNISPPATMTTSNVIQRSSPIITPLATEPINASSIPLSVAKTPTPFIMSLNNIFPSFEGTAEERPVQFLTEFEIRASTIVGQNDNFLLQTVQQALSEAALIWFGQMQRSSDRVHTWEEFRIRFYERYRTQARIQHFRTE